MRIAIIVEGETERAFLPHLRAFLSTRLSRQMPKLDPVPHDGRIPKGEKLKRVVDQLLSHGRPPADAVIAVTDVYTGTNPPDFVDAADAKAKMRQWVGPNPRFHAHAAQHDFEAWLLPFWDEIQRLAKSNRKAQWSSPEQVNHTNSTALSQCKELTQSFPPTGLASNKRSRITSPIVWSQILISQKVAALHTLRLGAGVLILHRIASEKPSGPGRLAERMSNHETPTGFFRARTCSPRRRHAPS